jgi:hypothetical protein
MAKGKLVPVTERTAGMEAATTNVSDEIPACHLVGACSNKSPCDEYNPFGENNTLHDIVHVQVPKSNSYFFIGRRYIVDTSMLQISEGLMHAILHVPPGTYMYAQLI